MPTSCWPPLFVSHPTFAGIGREVLGSSGENNLCLLAVRRQPDTVRLQEHKQRAGEKVKEENRLKNVTMFHNNSKTILLWNIIQIIFSQGHFLGY